MNKFLSCIILFLFIYFFIKCTKETDSEVTNEIIVPKIIKTESQIRYEDYKPDSLYGSNTTLEDYCLVIKKLVKRNMVIWRSKS